MGGIPLRRSRLDDVARLRVDGRAIDVPRYAPPGQRRICHIGVGGFHRSHQAYALHRLHQAGRGGGWGITGIGLTAADRAIDLALAAQDGLYSLWTHDGRGRSVDVIGSITGHVDATADPGAALAALADPATAIVSLTITEAGYCLDAAGVPDPRHPDLVHDLGNPRAPRSAPGLVLRALQLRRDAGGRGFTALSCDNLIGNGQRLREAVLGLARLGDPSLARWIEQEVRFPCSMVDRITPAMSADRRRLLCDVAGIDDAAPVVCEDWFQWVVEDDFVAGRPVLEEAGALFSHEVPRFEALKVGLLNGGHSALAHAGLLQGEVFVHAAMADPLLRDWVAAYMGEVATTLQLPRGVDVLAYRASLLQRFANPAIEDRLQRLAQDTREKFRQALLPPLIARLRADAPVPALATAVALWMSYLQRLAQDARARSAYQDADRDGLIAAAAGELGAFLARALPVPPELAQRFHDHVAAQLRGLEAGLSVHLAALVAQAG